MRCSCVMTMGKSRAMKKIISGKRYDTETATLVTEWESGYPSDLGY